MTLESGTWLAKGATKLDVVLLLLVLLIRRVVHHLYEGMVSINDLIVIRDRSCLVLNPYDIAMAKQS